MGTAEPIIVRCPAARMTCDDESPRVGSPVDAHAARREILGEFPLALVRDVQRVDASLRLPHADRPVLLDRDAVGRLPFVAVRHAAHEITWRGRVACASVADDLTTAGED
jgi:hypothetical protein